MQSEDQRTTALDDTLVRDLYLFSELVCRRCDAEWVPDQESEIGAGPEPWADRFSMHFGRVARTIGWGSCEGNVLCPSCLAGTRRKLATNEPRTASISERHVSQRVELWALRIVGALFFAVSAFGFTNAFVLKMHGPGGDLGVVAGGLAIGTFVLAHRIAKPN
jgi:hypothetical protein